MLHIPNALIMETVRGYLEGWYNDVVIDRMRIADGHISLPQTPGLGTRLHDDFASRRGAQVQVTTEETVRNG